MGKTLWQLWTEKAIVEENKAPEEKIFNPLGLKIGASITLDVLDWRDYHFFVREIRENKRDGPPFTDYTLLARPLGKTDITVKLRCFSQEMLGSGLPFQPVLLNLYDEFGWNEDFMKILNDKSLRFDCYQDEVLEESFLRIGGLSDPCRLTVTVVREDSGKSKTFQEGLGQYWDYSCTGKDEANQDCEFYLFVEMTESNHWFQIWKGEEIDPSRVILM